MYPYDLELTEHSEETGGTRMPALVLSPDGYDIVDADNETATPLIWPEIAGGRIHWDGLDDGSWPVCVVRANVPASHYRIYWAYPFKSRIHVWIVSLDGIRESSRDLSAQEAREFLSSQAHYSPAFIRARLVALALEEQDPDSEPVSSATAIEPADCARSIELCYLVIKNPSAFNEALLSAAQHSLSKLLPRVGLSRYRNVRAFESRFGPLRQALDVGSAERDYASQMHISLDYSKAATKLEPQLADTLPLLLPGDHCSDRLRSDGLKYSFSISPKPALRIALASARNASERDFFVMAYLTYLVDGCRDDLTQFSGRQNRMMQASGIILTQDIPPKIDVPCLGFQRKKGENLITLLPDPHFFMSVGYRETREFAKGRAAPWRDRTNAVFWRGSTTGTLNLLPENVFDLPRTQLCMAARDWPNADCLITQVVQTANENDRQQVQKLLVDARIFGKTVPPTEACSYRFGIDIDGNANAWSLVEKLLYGICVLKVETSWEQWFYYKMRPWVHYIPVRRDLSDLEYLIEWCMTHEDQAERIAARGQQFALGMTFDTEIAKARETMCAIGALDWPSKEKEFEDFRT